MSSWQRSIGRPREVNAQRFGLAQQRATAQASYNRQMQQLANKVKLLEARQKKTEFDERRLTKPNTGLTPRVRTLAREVKALTTYDEFPIESERRRVLALFP